MKRFITVISAIAAAFTFASAAAAQEIDDHLSLLYNGELVSVMFDVEREEKFTAQQAKLYSILECGINSRTEKIDVSEAGYKNVAEIKYFVTETLNVEAFWEEITGDITFTVNDTSGIIESIEVEYYPMEENAINTVTFAFAGNADAKTEIKTVREGVNHALREVEDDMSDVEKALVLHDYIVRECDYYPGTMEELEEIGRNDPDHYMFKADGVFIYRQAVCQGYAIAYSMLLRECNITSCIVVSDDMNHAWNMVKIGGEWYHVDATWDDPSNIRDGFVYHKYFLKSDDEFADESLGEKERHYNWHWEYDLFPGIDIINTPEANVSNSFPNYSFREIIWDNVIHQPRLLNRIDGMYYTLLHGSYAPGEFYSNSLILCVTNFEGDNRTFYEFKEFSLGTSYNFLVEYEGKLYASSNNKIVELDKTGNIVRYLVIEREDKINHLWLNLDQIYYSFSDGTMVLDLNSNATECIDDVVYALYDDGTADVIGYEGTVPKDRLIIPAYVNGHKVVEIGNAAFFEASQIDRIVLPTTIQIIKSYAFAGAQIQEILLPTGLRAIEDFAFEYTPLTEVDLPVTLTTLGYRAFYGSGILKDVKFHGDVPENWGAEVFANCGNEYYINGVKTDLFNIKVNPLRKTWQLAAGEDGKFTWTHLGITYKVEKYGAPAVGDFDGDDEVTVTDVVTMADFFAGKTADAPAEEWADIDKKDGVTRKDAMLLARYNAGWNSVKSYFEE